MLQRLFTWLAGSSPRQRQPRRPHLESLETRLTPASWVAVAPNPGVEGQVEIWNTTPARATLVGRIRPFNGFTNGLRIALGDTDRDGTPEVFVSPGVNGAPQVAQYKFDGRNFVLARTITVFTGSFRPGLTLAVGDVSGDTKPELIVSHSRSTGSNATIVVFDTSGATAIRKQQFTLQGGGTTGVRLTTADTNADGKQDVVAAPETTTSPLVRIFNGGVTQVNTAFRTVNIVGFQGNGMNITAGNIDGVGGEDLIISPNSAVGATTRRIFIARFNVSNTPTVTIIAQPASLYPNGIRVAAFNFDTTNGSLSEIATIAAVNGPRVVRILGPGGALKLQFSVGAFLPVTRKPGFDIAAITF